MPTCRICQHAFNSLKFRTENISICARCINTLNESPEPARSSEARLAEKLARGMQRNAEGDLHADEEWKRQKAKRTLVDIDAAVAASLHNWITRLLAKPENNTRDFMLMRAHRRGLLRAEGFSDYPKEWADVAHRTRRRDGYKCTSCDATDTTLDVHHIIYLSNHGTNQQSNLITLCRKCHEAEHKRIFDWPEAKDPESPDPIRPSQEVQTSTPLTAPQEQPSVMPTTGPALTMLVDIVAPPSSRTELRCPTCLTELTIPSNLALPGKIVRCPKCIVTFDFGMSRSMAAVAQVVRKSNQSIVQPPSRPTDFSRDTTRSPDVILTSKSRKPVSMGTMDLLVVLAAALAFIFLISYLSL